MDTSADLDSNRPTGPITTTRTGTVVAQRFVVETLLGRGGMGEVYLARHLFIDRRYALKFLHPGRSLGKTAIERFHLEAHVASTIKHPNVVGIEDFGMLPDGTAYLAMEFVEGEPLDARLGRDPSPSLDETLDIVIGACAGLAAAHDKGIVHRDVKPENIFLARGRGGPVPRILDFGLAKVVGVFAPAERLSRTGDVLGTAHYIAPEQAQCLPVDGRADVYSMGVILYEMCAGRLPFDAPNAIAIVAQHVKNAPRPPSEVAPERGIPLAVEAAILRAMAKSPDDRFPDMRAFMDELDRIRSLRRQGVSNIFPRLETDTNAIPTGFHHAARLVALDGEIASERPRRTPAVVAATVHSRTEAPAPALVRDRRRAPRSTVLALAGALLAMSSVIVVAEAARVHGWRITDAAPALSRLSDAGSAERQANAAERPELRPVELSSAPVGAKVLDQYGGELGVTPLTVMVDVAQPRLVTLKRRGYLDQPATLDTHIPRRVVELHRR